MEVTLIPQASAPRTYRRVHRDVPGDASRHWTHGWLLQGPNADCVGARLKIASARATSDLT